MNPNEIMAAALEVYRHGAFSSLAQAVEAVKVAYKAAQEA